MFLFLFFFFTKELIFFNADLVYIKLIFGEIFKLPVLIRSGGGIHNYLYQLRSSSQGSAQMKVEGSNILGKFQITWHTNLGKPGRLQTQQILGSVTVSCIAGVDAYRHVNVYMIRGGKQAPHLSINKQCLKVSFLYNHCNGISFCLPFFRLP